MCETLPASDRQEQETEPVKHRLPGGFIAVIAFKYLKAAAFLFVGVVESLCGLYLGESLGQIGIFLMFILVLLFRPSGLLGERA